GKKTTFSLTCFLENDMVEVMKTGPIYALLRKFSFGLDSNEVENGIRDIEAAFGKLHGIEGSLKILCIVMPAFLAGVLVAYFGLWDYMSLVLASLFSIIFGLLMHRFLNS